MTHTIVPYLLAQRSNAWGRERTALDPVERERWRRSAMYWTRAICNAEVGGPRYGSLAPIISGDPRTDQRKDALRLGAEFVPGPALREGEREQDVDSDARPQ
jgi:hypothetical protein